MQNGDRDCPCTGRPAGGEGPAGPRAKISPEALERLSRAPLPPGFRQAVREGMPAMEETPDPSDLPRAAPEIDMMSFETRAPDVPVRPVEMPGPAPFAGTDPSSPNLGATLSYLTEWRLDLTGVAHMTPGLQELADLPLGQLLCETQGGAGGGVFLCQQDGDGDENGDDKKGGTVVDEPINPDGEITGEGEGGCRVRARFGLAVRQPSPDGSLINAGIAWASAGKDVPTDVWAALDQEVGGLQAPVPEGTGPYPGTLEITWQANGNPTSAIDREKRLTPVLQVSADGEDDLRRKVEKLDRDWRDNGRFFRFMAPAQPGITVVTATVTWKPDRGPACTARATFNLNWVAAARPDPFPKDGPTARLTQTNAIEHTEGSLQSFVRDDAAFVVTPVRYVWSVEESLRTCCGQQASHRVIQFARAVIDSEVDWLDRTKPWGLDIKESEKQRARDRQSFDPAFTDAPSQRETQVDTHSGKQAVSHWDGPGMSEVRYRQLLLKPGQHAFHQQFFALLVCARGGRRGAADKLLGEYKVVKAAIYTVTWTFDGPVDKPGRVDVRARVNAQQDLGCKSLRAVLAANGLLDAFRAPPSSELGPSRDHAGDLAAVTGPQTIRAP